jgi:ketosteroid isomerase-like protein
VNIAGLGSGLKGKADMANTKEQADKFIDALHQLEKGSDNTEAALNAITELYADDATLTNAALRLTNEERKGREQIRAFWADYKRTLGDSYSEFHQVAVNEEAAGLFWVTRGQSANGQPDAVHYDGTTLLVYNGDGKIAHFHGYYDTRQLNRQMGIEPDPSGKASSNAQMI